MLVIKDRRFQGYGNMEEGTRNISHLNQRRCWSSVCKEREELPKRISSMYDLNCKRGWAGCPAIPSRCHRASQRLRNSDRQGISISPCHFQRATGENNTQPIRYLSLEPLAKP